MQNKNTILIGIAVVAILVTGALIFMNSAGSGLSFLNFGSKSQDAVVQDTLAYINANLLAAGNTAVLEKAIEESGMIRLDLKIGNNRLTSYVTKDGKIFFTEGIRTDGQSNNPNPTATGPVKTSIDNDAALGDKNAPVTLVEFSDYECPFCKRYFEQTYPEIKKNYVDTGKVKIVFRDYVAVQGHNPLATSEAMAAECAREQGGDAMYFKYHDELFKRTTSNGSGLKLSELQVIAKDLGLNANALQQCLDSNKYKEEFNKDNADASAIGLDGTPSFIIGKSTADGTVEGNLVKGAQPYAAFQTAIEAALK